MRYKVLVVDDERDVLEPTRQLLSACGYEVFASPSGEEGLRYLLSVPLDLILIDFKLPGMSGIDFLRVAKTKNPQIKAILMTGLGCEMELVLTLARYEGAAVLRKPVRSEELRKTVQQALDAKAAA